MEGTERPTRKEAMATMTSSGPTGVTMLGLGTMGSVLAASLVCAGHPTTVWNGRRAAPATWSPAALSAHRRCSTL